MVERRTYPPPPPPSEGTRPSTPPEGERREGEPRESERRAIADLLRKGLEAGRGTLEKNLGESFFPRDVASQLVSTIGDLKQGVVTAVAQEVGRFLRQADIAAEIRQVLTGLEVEAKVQLTFRETAAGDVGTDMRVEEMQTTSRRWRGRGGTTPPPAQKSPEPEPGTEPDSPT